MNILMALSQLEVTGAEVYGVTLANELISRGNNVIIVSDTLTKETKAQYIKIEFNKRGINNRIDQVKKLLKIIKENDIQVVHAHSRASSWSASIACKIADIPLITTTHGRQPVHLSRKIIKAFGDLSLAVCENVKDQLQKELNFTKVKVLRNPIDVSLYKYQELPKNEEKIVSIIGRLSGPKGEVTYSLLDRLIKIPNIKIRVIGGKEIPQKFSKFLDNEKIDFLGYINDVDKKISESDVVIGAGRVAVEAILSGRPVIAVGEAKYIGLMTETRVQEGLETNFGDIAKSSNDSFDWDNIRLDIEMALVMSSLELFILRERISKEFNKNHIITEIENIYAKLYVKKKKYEIPVIMYHRVIENMDEAGVHGIYVKTNTFEKHLKYLKNNGYETVTFHDLANNNYKKRFDKDKKLIILTFDDGYEDNYIYAYPLLKKYGFKATIFLLSDLNYNKWDVESPNNPEMKFNLMNLDMIKEMQDYGIEFGGHTKTHPKLAEIELSQAREEILESKQKLEEKLGKKLITFAYPYGNMNEAIKNIVKEAGYEFAVATDSGDISFSTDLFKIRRIGIFSTNSFLTFKRKVSGRYNFIKIKREQKEKLKKGETKC